MQNNVIQFPTPQKPTLGEYISQILDDNCCSHREFARVTGIDNSYISKLIKGRNKPLPHTLKILAQGLERLDGRDWKEHAKEMRQ